MVGNPRFVDGTWYHKGDRNGLADFLEGPRIEGAVHFDLSSEAFSSPNQLHPQPTVPQFESAMTASGIQNTDTVIIYASSPWCYFLPRVWFTFRHVMGHEKTFLLQGTLQDWIDAGGAVEHGNAPKYQKEKQPTKVPYKVSAYHTSVMIGLDEMERVVASGEGDTSNTTVILDARGSSFAKGHMPGAHHVPYKSLHNADNERNDFKSPAELRLILDQTSVLESDNVVLTCGSGVSACSLYLALKETGYDGQARVYDGSWFEWNSQADTPKVVPSKQRKN